MDISLLISAFSALVAIISAFFAYLQVKQAKKSTEQAQKNLLEVSTQNKISALIALKNYYEKEIPRIKVLADAFSAPETYASAGKPLHDEREEVKKKLQRVNGEIDQFYEFYVSANSVPKNG